MKQTDFQRLKQICEKEGFELLNESENDNGKFFVITRPKDIWEGVEFGESMESGKIITANKIYKFISSGRDHVTIIDDLNDRTSTKITYFKPSTEQAYIEQLKTEAFKRFGDIKEGDRFDRNWISAPFNISKIGDIKNALGTGFFYSKKNDELFFDSINIYRSGKWATKIPKKIEVTVSGYDLTDYKTHNCFEVEFFIHDSEEFDRKIVSVFLARKLEEYLNEKK